MNHFSKKSLADSYYKDTPITFILFDFDGVIADSFDVAIDVCNKLSGSYGFNKILPQQRLQLKHLSMKDIITQHLKISWYQIPFFHKAAVGLIQKYILTIPPAAGIVEALKNFKNCGYRLGILSSNGEENIRKFLCHNDVDIFDIIYSDSSLFGKHRVIKRFLKKFNVSREQVIYIGDEVRDIQAAKKAGIRIIAANCGFNSHEALHLHNPDGIVSHPSDLIVTIQTLHCQTQTEKTPP